MSVLCPHLSSMKLEPQARLGKSRQPGAQIGDEADENACSLHLSRKRVLTNLGMVAKFRGEIGRLAGIIKAMEEG